MPIGADTENGSEGRGDSTAGDRPTEALHKISDVHQIALGRAFGGIVIDIFILFPNLYCHRNKSSESTSNFLTDEEECLWTGGVFLPSLIECLPSYLFTEVPGSWRAAIANSLACSSERAQLGSAKNIPR
jgi:hypothetical protein